MTPRQHGCRAECVYCERASAHGDMLCQEHARSVDNARAAAEGESEEDRLRAELTEARAMHMRDVEMANASAQQMATMIGEERARAERAEEELREARRLNGLACCAFCGEQGPREPESMVAHALVCEKRTDGFTQALRLATTACNEVTALRGALRNAIVLAEEGWSYASDYFRHKWYFDKRSALLRKMLGAEPDAMLEEMSDAELDAALAALGVEP